MKNRNASISVLVLVCILLLGNIAFADSEECPVPLIPEDVEYPEGWLLEWDTVNSAAEFPTGEPPVSVAVIGGEAPYTWEVNDGFSLACEEICGTGNTLSSLGTECIATITVTDSAGRKTTGKVRRPGYWSECYYDSRWGCYNNSCNSYEMTWMDMGDHQVRFGCCEQSRSYTWTGTCNDGWSYTAKAEDCMKPGGCEISGVNNLLINKWVCD